MLLYGGIGPGVPHIMAIAAPGANNLDSGEAWVIRACMVRGGAEFKVDELGSYFLSFTFRRNWSRFPPYSGRS